MSDFRTAVLICQRFPYSQETGEVYLRTEIDVLAAHSDKVIVLPCFSEGEVTPFRLPENVIVRSVAAGVDGIVQRSEGIRAAVRIFTPGFKCMYLGASENFRERLFLESMYGLADKVRSNTGNVLEELGVISREIDVVYSYRLTLTAHIGMFVSDWVSAHGHGRPLTVSRAHGYDLYKGHTHGHIQPFRAEVMNGMDCIFPCSEEGSAYMRTEYPAYANKIETLYLGSRDISGRNPFRMSDVIKIVSCSTLAAVKRVDLIVDAVKILCDKGVKVQWTHIGSGRGFSALEKRCDKLLQPCSFKLLGTLDNDEVVSLYSGTSFDLFVNVSSSEGIPQAIMEALSFGIPVAATEVGGNSEIVHDGLNGWLLDPDNVVEGLVGVVEYYMGFSASSKEALRQSAHDVWESNFCAKHNAERFISRLSGNAGARRQ